jgi:hypothetical protein
MNTISIPNFSAEASLYKTSVYYGGISNGGIQANKGVVPSIILCGPCQVVNGQCLKYCMNCSGRPGAPFCDTLTTKPCTANECQTCGPCTCTKNCGGVIEPC